MSENRFTVLIPSFNTGASLLRQTVTNVLGATELPLLLVIDGSTDGSGEAVKALEEEVDRFTILHLPHNSGKGEAVRHGVLHAVDHGFTHALVMDADGQHPAESIDPMVALVGEGDRTMIMGDPIFGPEAPLLRKAGRKITLTWTDLESLWRGLGDTLFGMRVYPLQPLSTVFCKTRFARGFEFDPEVAVRLFWMGIQPIKIAVPCRYLSPEEGAVSHFHYLRDNLKLTALHFRLVPEFLLCHLWRLLFAKK